MSNKLQIEQGQRVADVRKDLHLTQTQLGKVLGISTSQVSAIERGDSAIQVNQLHIMWQRYQVNANFIISADFPAFLGGEYASEPLSQYNRPNLIGRIDKLEMFISTIFENYKDWKYIDDED